MSLIPKRRTAKKKHIKMSFFFLQGKNQSPSPLSLLSFVQQLLPSASSNTDIEYYGKCQARLCCRSRGENFGCAPHPKAFLFGYRFWLGSECTSLTLGHFSWTNLNASKSSARSHIFTEYRNTSNKPTTYEERFKVARTLSIFLGDVSNCGWNVHLLTL